MFNMESIGRRISHLRKEQNMTQMELADQLNISFQAVSNWERGGSMPDISKLPELAQILEVSIDELLGQRSRLLEKAIEGTMEEYLEENVVTTDELSEIAPLLKPKQVDGILGHIEPSNMGALSGLAPFISQDVLGELALKMVEGGDYPHIVSLAPFLSKEVMGKLAELVYSEQGFAGLCSIFPFISQDRLEEMTSKEFAKNGSSGVAVIAPFLSQQFLNELAKEIIEKEGIDGISSIAPFLSQKVLSDYIKEFIL